MRWIVPFAFLTSACAVVAGLGDDYTGSARGGGADAATSDGAPDEGGSSDAGAEGVVVSDAGPSFCDYVEYFSFDDTLAGITGAVPTNTSKPHAYDPGKYGKCAAVGKVGEDVTSFQYSEPSHYAPAAGTVAFWFKPDGWKEDVATNARVLYGSGGDTVGPMAVWAAPDSFAVKAPLNAKTASIGVTWKDNDWNHLTATYRLGQAPPVQMAIDGVAVDGNGTYSPGGAFKFVLGDDAVAPDACFDEVAIWARVLAGSEIQAIYGLTVPLEEACRLTRDR